MAVSGPRNDESDPENSLTGKGTVVQPPRAAPLRDRHISFAIRGRALVVPAPVAVLGSVRNPAAHVPLLGRLHRQHAMISRLDGKYWLTRAPHHSDVTAVNGTECDSPHPLENGDRIVLGAKEGRGRCELTFLLPENGATTAVLRQERRWTVTPSGDAFDRIVLLDQTLTIGRAETSHIFAPRLACPEVRLSWGEAGLTAGAAGGRVYQETPEGEWDDPPTPLSIPCRLYVSGDEDLAQQILSDYQRGGEVDERVDLIDPTRRL
jgi:hypothetical protein